MEVAEIYSTLATHMITGMMIHEELANYYDFLGLKGYKRCHEYHFLAESCSYRKLCRYYINHFNRLIPYSEVETPQIIPDSWYRYSREEVDPNTKKNAVKNGLQKWVEWETETKRLYEDMYRELMNINEVSAALDLKEHICDVDKELKTAERYLLNKKAVEYDMVLIIEEQDKKHEKYRKKTACVGKSLC